MRKTCITLVIICMLAVLLTGCTGADRNNNGVPDVVPSPYVSPYASPYVSPYNNAPYTSPYASPYVSPGYGNGNLVSPMPTVLP